MGGGLRVGDRSPSSDTHQTGLVTFHLRAPDIGLGYRPNVSESSVELSEDAPARVIEVRLDRSGPSFLAGEMACHEVLAEDRVRSTARSDHRGAPAHSL